jgi:hypothetical protein
VMQGEAGNGGPGPPRAPLCGEQLCQDSPHIEYFFLSPLVSSEKRIIV